MKAQKQESKNRTVQEHQTCPRCGEPSLTITTYHDKHYPYGDFDFTQSTCENCGFIDID